VRLTFTEDSVVVVAGVPGAGKTTLIRRTVDPAAVRVVDTADLRGGRRPPAVLLYPAHYLRIVAAVLGRRPAVIHSRGTHATLRRAIAVLAGLRGRPAHLVLLDAARDEAEAGQRARGRRVRSGEMERQVSRWRRLMRHGARGEGWASVVVLDRPTAARTEAMEFLPAALPVGAATM
jgi:Viral (Superfamily 1) RNA helicase